MSRGVVLRRRLRHKSFALPVYVTPEAGLRYWRSLSQADPFLCGMAEELVQPGSTVWDVGGNVGLFTFCAAAVAGTSGLVLSIEPDIFLAQLMTRSSREHSRLGLPCSRVEVLCASVSDSNRIARLEVAERARASSHLLESSGSTQSGGARYAQATPTVTLDFLLDYFPAPSILKIDVETHEVNVLKGARKLLAETRPTILCEVSHENSDAVTEILHDAGYELYGAEMQPHPVTKRAWFQTLALPSSSVKIQNRG